MIATVTPPGKPHTPSASSSLGIGARCKIKSVGHGSMIVLQMEACQMISYVDVDLA